MVFVDLLTSQLFSIGFIGLLVAYTTFKMMKNRKGSAEIQGASVPLLALGFYALITGLFGQFTWPLPGSYNILFYDVYTLLGVLVISFAWCLRSGASLKYTGLFSFLLGLTSIYYGIQGYILGLTSEPIALLGLYSLFGLSGVFTYPVTLMLDGKKNSGSLKITAYIFWLVLVLGSLLALYIAISAVPAHLASPP